MSALASKAVPSPVPSYFPALDGMRFFCCTAVIVAHSFLEARIIADTGHPLHAFVGNLGATGVEIFFALSGFLITKLLLDEFRSRKGIDLKAFYIRRTLRIWPVYYVALVIAFAMPALLGEHFTRPLAYSQRHDLLTAALPYYLFYLGNWCQVAVPLPLAIRWSVCVEEQFYILFPASFAFTRRRFPALRSIVVGLLVAWSVRAWLVLRAPDSIYRNTFAHSDHLLLGALLAQLLHARPHAIIQLVRRSRVWGEIATVGACLAFTAFNKEHVTTVAGWLAYYLVSASIATSLIAVFALGVGPLARELARPSLRWLGGLTYAGHVFHAYAVTVGWGICRRLALWPWSAAVARSLVAIPLTYAIAYLSKVFVEKRFLELKRRFQPASSADGSAITNTLVGDSAPR